MAEVTIIAKKGGGGKELKKKTGRTRVIRGPLKKNKKKKESSVSKFPPTQKKPWGKERAGRQTPQIKGKRGVGQGGKKKETAPKVKELDKTLEKRGGEGNVKAFQFHGKGKRREKGHHDKRAVFLVKGGPEN